MQVSMDPDWSAGPGGCCCRVLPDRADSRRLGNQLQADRRSQGIGRSLSDLFQSARTTAPRGRVRGSWSMEGGQEGGERHGSCRTCDRGDVCWRPRDPCGDDPRTRKTRGGCAQTLGYGDRQREKRRQPWNPCALLEQEIVRGFGGPREPDGEVVTEPPQLVVPPASTEGHRTVRKVGVLVLHECLHEFCGDVHIMGRHPSNASRSAPARAQLEESPDSAFRRGRGRRRVGDGGFRVRGRRVRVVGR